MKSLEEWKAIKEYYEKEYNGVMPSETAEEFAEEMEVGEAGILLTGTEYSISELTRWIRGTANNFSEEEIIEEFPSFNFYIKYVDEIAAYFLHKRINEMRDAVERGEEDYIEIAAELEWGNVFPEEVTETFLF